MSTRAGARDVRLNLGCGNEPLAGFLNIDLEGEGADVLMDARRLAVADGTVAELHACHLIEHLGYIGGSLVLAEWYRVLRDGAKLTLETPDLPKSMQMFLEGDFETRAQVINWIFGLESRGMGHRIGFEFALLEKMLNRAGFGDVRSEPPTYHPDFPGLRLTAVKRRSAQSDARADLLRRVTDFGPSFDDQAVMLELIDTVVPEIVSVLADTKQLEARLAPLLARLVVYHVAVARTAFALARTRLPEATSSAWAGALESEHAAQLGRQVTAELLSRPIRPGGMEATYREVRDLGRAVASTLIGLDSGKGAQLNGSGSKVVVVPFSRAGLIREAWRRYGRGARLFARGDLTMARHQLELAARLNSDQPVLLWNIARAAAVRADFPDAATWLEQAATAAERAGAAILLGALRDELAALHAGQSPAAALVAPSSREGGGRS